MVAAVRNAPPRVQDVSRVLMDLRPGDRLDFGGTGVTIELVGKSGRQARLCVVAPRMLPIKRVEAGEAALPPGYTAKTPR